MMGEIKLDVDVDWQLTIGENASHGAALGRHRRVCDADSCPRRLYIDRRDCGVARDSSLLAMKAMHR